MAKTLTTLGEFQSYFSKVAEKAESHAPNVSEVIFVLAGALLRTEAEEIQVWEREGETGNVLWLKTPCQWYTFSYDRQSQSVTVRRKWEKGSVFKKFTNQSDVNEIISFFNKL